MGVEHGVTALGGERAMEVLGARIERLEATEAARKHARCDRGAKGLEGCWSVEAQSKVL